MKSFDFLGFNGSKRNDMFLTNLKFNHFPSYQLFHINKARNSLSLSLQKTDDNKIFKTLKTAFQLSNGLTFEPAVLQEENIHIQMGICRRLI